MIKYCVIKLLILLKTQNMMDINVELFQWAINFLIKKTSGGDATLARSETLAARNKSAIKNENISNVELAEELHKAIIRKANKKKYTHLL